MLNASFSRHVFSSLPESFLRNASSEITYLYGITYHFEAEIVKIHAAGSQQVFEDIERETEEIGMKTNGKKPQLLGVSNTIHSAPSTFISVGVPSSRPDFSVFQNSPDDLLPLSL